MPFKPFWMAALMASATALAQPVEQPEAATTRTARTPGLTKPAQHFAVTSANPLAARVGLETLVLDLTRPDVGLHVAKVTVPGLRHFWPRFGPGRLYDIPVKLGWLSRPLTEAQLNPVPFLL